MTKIYGRALGIFKTPCSQMCSVAGSGLKSSYLGLPGYCKRNKRSLLGPRRPTCKSVRIFFPLELNAAAAHRHTVTTLVVTLVHPTATACHSGGVCDLW